MNKNSIASLVTLLFCANAAAKFPLPDLSSNEKKTEFITNLEIEAPWLNGRSATIVAGGEPLIPQLMKDRLWNELAARRGQPVEIIVEEVKPIAKEVRRVKDPVMNLWKTEIAHWLGEMPQSKLAPEEFAKHARAELDWLLNHDARALATGLINCLPRELRGNFFKLGSVKSQWQSLSESQVLNDQLVQASFRAEDFGLEKSSLSRDSLLGLLRESLEREKNFVSLLRAGWIAAKMSADQWHEFVRNPVESMAATDGGDLDLFTQGHLQNKLFFESLLGVAANDKRRSDFLQKLGKSVTNEKDYQLTMGSVDSVVNTYRVQEASAALAATRGWLMKDCSMYAYGFAFSPQEYIYLVFGANNQPVGFVAATAVQSGNDKVLFVHDFGGTEVSAELASTVIHGLHKILPELGFQKMTVSGANVNVGEWSRIIAGISGEKIAQTYLDAGIRHLISDVTKSPHAYDLPTNPNNLTAALFRPIESVAMTTRVRLFKNLRGRGAELEGIQSKQASILQVLAIFNANPEAGITDEMLRDEGVRANEIHYLFNELKNDHRRPLEEYYQHIAAVLGKFKIKFSAAFAREHPHLFRGGHLKAPDAATAPDPAQLNRTVNYITQILKSQTDVNPALDMIREHKARFLTNDRFNAYLKSFTGRGQNEPNQLAQLMELGFTFDYLTGDAEAMLRMANFNSPVVRHWALAHLPKDYNGRVPAEVAQKLATDLALDDDHIPRLASKRLLHMRSGDPEVLRQLKETVEQEDEVDIALRAALALHLNGQDSIAEIQKYHKEALDAGTLDPESDAIVKRIMAEDLQRAKQGCEAALLAG